MTVAGAISALTVASLGLLAWGWFTGTTVTAAGTAANLDGATVDVRGAEWVFMDHVDDGGGGFLMPDEMMPGAPTGDEVRLGVNVTLTNTRSRTHHFRLVDEFTMAAGEQPEPVPLSADTVGELGRLGPGSALHATLYFDVEVTDTDQLPPLYLQWTRGRDTVLIPVPTPGEAPVHQH